MNKIEIPQQLQDYSFNFVLVNKHNAVDKIGKNIGKAPIEKGWQNKSIKFDNFQLKNHLENGGNYGVLCGGEKNLLVVDLDDIKNMEEIREKLPKTFTIKTGSGKYHLYFYSNNLKKYKILDEEMNTIADVQGEGTQVIAPNSIHPTTKEAYKILEDREINFIDYEELKKILIPYHKENKTNNSNLTQTIKKAENRQIKKEEYSLADKIVSKLDVSDVLSDLSIDTSKNPTDCPFHSSKGGKCFSYTDEKWNCFHCGESGNIFSLIQKAKNLNSQESLKYLSKLAGIENEFKENKIIENKKEKKSKDKKEFSDHFNSFNIKVKDLFLNQNNEPYLSVKINDHLEHKAIESKFISEQILINSYENYLGVPSKDMISQIQSTLKAMCLSEGKKREMGLRFIGNEEKIIIDLIRKDWKAIEITKDKIQFLNSDEVCFERFNHMKEISPDLNAEIEDINLFAKDFDLSEIDNLMLKVDLITSFIPNIANTINQIHGAMGSGKSFLTKQFRAVCDPSETEALIFPENEQEMLLQARQHAVLLYDNMRSINNRTSDLMCSISTGASISQRKLYTDNETIISKLRRKIILNGINRSGSNSDFGDRSIEISLKRISPTKRKTEAELKKDFEKVLPKIQGSSFKIIQKAMEIKPKIKLPKLPRMADYCLWGESISQVLGYPEGHFVKIYFDKIRDLSLDILEASDVSKAVLVFAEQRKNWEGTALDLYKEINEIAEKILKIDTKYDKYWVKSSVSLGKKLSEFEPVLETRGVFISRRKSHGTRLIKIKYSGLEETQQILTDEKENPMLELLKEREGEMVSFDEIKGFFPNISKSELNKLKEEAIIFEPKKDYFQLM